eukprot:CAMPEP_0206317444 /NCGR_PEP_ID=MMETSP0106_2-20121207/16643_1 /ASSEMBLY_ACC=CAM_ASM_000206 /TAXON_ID=81532 /ORGANISM="Acanthoeca-like sp., Strain 10tr" /LENGTH=111 /DNA_ID=CAMNT_0053749045 /DNA_START=29 /DNA_END=364 /DNA_ORIENTATION=-
MASQGDKFLNNTGGKVLIGNYVEERFAAEAVSAKTNFNLAGTNAALELRSGNTGAVAPVGGAVSTSSMTSTQRADFGRDYFRSGEAADRRWEAIQNKYPDLADGLSRRFNK